MAGWAPPSGDLVLSRLLDQEPSASWGISEASELARRLLELRPAPDPRSVQHALRLRESSTTASLEKATAEYSPLTAGGVETLLDLHATPDREVFADGRALLLRRHGIGDDATVHSAIWTVDRSANRAVLDGRLSAIDEFHGPNDLVRLEGLLFEWARDVRFVPEMARLRVAAVLTERALLRDSDLSDSLCAMGAVYGAKVDVFVADHDPRDTKRAADFERRLRGGGYHLVVTMSERDERWVWKLANRLKQSGVQFEPLHSVTTSDSSAELASVLSVVARSWPERPAKIWDANAVRRAELLVCESFVITERGKRHLLRNRYPDPERMLSHLESLARCALAWNESMHADAIDAGRFEDWAYEHFSLKIALHDKGIDSKSAAIEYDGLTLDNRPHVKVDDFVAAADCGRIYFAVDDRRTEGVRRLVVDHIGLHDRS